jgi:Mrp family chromosome partitioning ATPase
VLEDRTPLGHQAVRLGTNVALSVNPGPVKNPANLFMKEKTSQILDRIELEYAPDVMIFDMPPMLVNDDATAFLKNVDCALIIAGAGKSTVSQVDSCEKEVAQYTNVLGTVLNMCDAPDENYGEAYGSAPAKEAV